MRAIPEKGSHGTASTTKQSHRVFYRKPETGNHEWSRVFVRHSLPAWASFVHLLNNYLIEYTERYLLIIGLIFIVIILLAPRGIVEILREHLRATSKESGS